MTDPVAKLVVAYWTHGMRNELGTVKPELGL